ncbi:MAG: hypothetical protein QME50_06635 [Candidatus Bathyarchaeota archaeon]|nr:hypothetical protein [Candidatus Bathyarchaeota archaeon]
MITRSKGTLILRRRGHFYKVIRVRHVRDYWWIFECKDIDEKEDLSFNFQILGMWELLDKASTMQDPKEVLLIDLDQQGKWIMWTQDELKQRLRYEEEEKKQRESQTRKAEVSETNLLLCFYAQLLRHHDLDQVVDFLSLLWSDIMSMVYVPVAKSRHATSHSISMVKSIYGFSPPVCLSG